MRRSTADVVAFSDANALWEPDALRALVAPFADDRDIGYVCGRVTFVNPDGGTNQEGVYWRYEMFLRARESDLASVTAGNGAIYATRRAAYVEVDPVMGHDLKFPFTLVRDGWRCVEQPLARATERMVPDVEGEAARKRRMMSHALGDRPARRPAGPARLAAKYTMMIASHRWLRYFGPALHLVALARAPHGAAPSAAAADRRRLRAGPRAAASARAVLRPDPGLDRARPRRPPPPRHRRRLGPAGGHALMREPLRRLFDVVVSAAVLAVTSPIVALAILAIRLESKGHPIYRQHRVGKDGAPFDVLKLRTMVSGAEKMGAGLAVDDGDSRITRVGALLRRTSIDELPNLVNVLKGEMSIIGPRPTSRSRSRSTPTASAAGSRSSPASPAGRRSTAAPRCPGPSASSSTSSTSSTPRWLLDLKILWLTARMLVTGHGLYKGETGGWVDPHEHDASCSPARASAMTSSRRSRSTRRSWRATPTRWRPPSTRRPSAPPSR